MLSSTLQHADRFALMRVLLFVGVLGVFAAQHGYAQPKSPDSRAYAVPVVVSDFELQSVPARPIVGARPAETPLEPKPGAPAMVYESADAPSVQARRLIDFFATSLLRALQDKGFRASRASGQNPPGGVLIRGVFAEPDARNRIRRALLGGTSPNSRFFLYVGIFNLARQDQPLYQAAERQSPGNRYGPVITMNTYVPMAKYELDKNPSEEDVQKICIQIAASLVTLLESNPNAFSH